MTSRLFRASALVLLAAALPATSGCGGSESPEAQAAATRFLQQNKHQPAIDALTEVEGGRSHYLRAVAFERMGRFDDARDQIASAVEAEPENADYRGLQLRLQLPERLRRGDFSAADELIALRDRNRTSAALSLFAFYAHVAKARYHNSKDDKPAARSSSQSAVSALQTSISLSADIPELQRELLELAVAAGLDEGAEILLTKLQQAAPDDLDLQRERIITLLKVKKPEEAAAVARDFFEKQPGNKEAAVLYSRAMRPGRATPARDKEFRALVDRHLAQPDIVTNYALYLARTRRLADASAVLTTAIEKQTDKNQRQHLVDVAVTLPLEAGDAELAEKQLNLYRQEIGDPVALDYYEGRLLFLKKDHTGALEKLRTVLEAHKEAVGPRRRYATEALLWTQRILQDKGLAAKLDQAVEALQQPRDGAAPDAALPAEAEVPRAD